MLLAIDVGNSNTCVGVFAGESLRCELRLSTRRDWTRDEVAIALERALALSELGFADLDDAVMASVVPPAVPAWKQALSRYVEIDPLIIGPGVRTGLPIRYDPPQDVGADRIASSVAAYHRYGGTSARVETAGDEPRGVIVVDFGTATTFDVVSPKPEYLGGVIAPGIGISADALFTRAAKLPRVNITRPASVIGRNTVSAIQSGLVYGYVSLVEGVLQRIRSELRWPVVVIGTGGFAVDVARESRCIEIVDDSLVLEGLRLVHARNRGAPSRRG
ncbi:MAG: type III pantothenate kinase [Myxococcales bacterium]|nr:type III pantothenate kinase [Myxococcales bacterium]MCB9748695.1 type III pantothenate kinase [Myxococcales bacterium]